ncbi:calpain-2 catalytic subunit-like [Anomaloglossus baeobatrachus]|uniref:calpain-2 catalytic subunit-like n=1 Tax=Anomaloglossus baeobatrachus TaxID=238106 RepID=UPI003F5040F1
MSGVASKAAGLGSFNNPIQFAGQDYEKLKAQCLASKTDFVDPQFKPDQSSLGKETDGLGPDSGKIVGVDGKWKRPKDLVKDPKFIVGGTELDDVCQQYLGDCWVIGSIACLTTNPDCLARVVPLDQSFDKDYAGIFRFKLWQYGQWVEVVVDDLLLLLDHELNFAISKTSNEFWSSLLEKAYAKINGSYENLVSSTTMEALADFSGGVSEKFINAPDGLFQKIQTALRQKSFVGCNSTAPDQSGFSASISRKHLYSIIRVEEVTYGETKEQLIKIRNPYGNEEWTGKWNDKSEEWNKLDPLIRKDLNSQKEDGEFWMPFSEFVKEFTEVEICDVTMSEICCGDNYKWCLTEYNGSWKKGSSSGGDTSSDMFWMNPQYPITLKAPDGDTSKKCRIVVSLMQKDRRKLKFRYKAYIVPGFYIYEVNPSDKLPLGMEFFKSNKDVGSFSRGRYREVAKRFELLPGNYVIVAANHNKEEDADYYLRVFTEKPTGAQHV